MKRRILFLVAPITYLIFLSPALISPIVGDDFVNPFYIFYSEGPSIVNWVRYGWYGGSGVFSNHSNFLGTITGTVINGVWLEISHIFRLPHSYFYIFLKLIAYLFLYIVIIKIVTFNTPKNNLKIRYLLTLCFTGTIQIHQLWSNDPVTNYPLSGLVSAAIGFLVVFYIMKFLSKQLRNDMIKAQLLFILSVLYYELNFALVLVFFYTSLFYIVRKRNSLRNFFIGMSISLVPFLLIFLRFLMASANRGVYEGTTFGTFSGTIKTLWVSIVSSLPTSAWDNSFAIILDLPDNLNNNFVAFQLISFIGLVCLVVATYFQIDSYKDESKQVSLDRLSILNRTVPVSLYGLGAIVIQSSTLKYQAELSEPGFVYTFYAVSHSAIAILLTIYFANIISRKDFRSISILFVILIFSYSQTLINLELLRASNYHNRFNVNLVKQFVESSSEYERCSALTDWNSIPWPSYYEEAVNAGLNSSFKHYYGQDFCKLP